jgi:quinol monooxygenase YgiN
MVLVLGSVLIHPGRLDEAIALSQEHVARSRAEPGCKAHAVHQDTENPEATELKA